MEPGQIAGNRSIDATIKRCFKYLAAEDVRTFTRKFRDQLSDERQVMHTFRELVLGGYLGSCGFRVRHEPRIGDRTPDWGLLGAADVVEGLVELVNFHAPSAMEREIEERRRAGRVWVGRVPSHLRRLTSCIQDKASAYGALADREGLPYVVTVFGDFVANVELDDVRDCLLDSGSVLFSMYPTLSGVLYFEEQRGTYAFTFLSNANAARALALPDGMFE